MKHAWNYGNVSHVYYFTDDRNPETADIVWGEEQMAKDEFQDSVTRILLSHHPLDGSYASETIVNGKDRMINDLQTYNVTHYLHGHLHTDWHHLWDGVHHFCAPQSYPFTDSQDLGGYIEYTVEQGNITEWHHYTDGAEVEIKEPVITTPTTETTTTTTAAVNGTPGFTWFITVVAIPLIVVFTKKKKK